MNGDGVIDSQDLQDLLIAFQEGEGIDYNGDGSVGWDDYFAFVDDFDKYQNLVPLTEVDLDKLAEFLAKTEIIDELDD